MRVLWPEMTLSYFSGDQDPTSTPLDQILPSIGSLKYFDAYLDSRPLY